MDTLFFRQPRLVMLALLVILSAGMSALVSIGRQEDPTITNIFATITTVFPGADPARVEALVTAKIETELRTIPEIAEVSSTSATGISVISVELIETVPPEIIEQLWAQVRDAVADAQREFPAGVLEPDFDSDGAGGYAAIFALTMSEGFSVTRAAREAEALADRLRRVPGTSLVDLHGVPEEEVLVTLDPDRTAALGLTADEVSAAIRAADAKVQAGRLRGDETDLVLGITGEITSLDRLRAVVLREDADGRVTLLGDVAEITRGPRLPPAEAALFQGQPAILVSAKLSVGLQVDRWMTGIRAAVDTQAEALPWGLAVETVFDQSRYTLERLAEVGMNMLVGVALVVVVLFVTLGWRSALIVAMVLPVVSLASVATLNALAVPIHQMSVTGLIVALGLLVDAAIVMTDEVGKRLSAGLTRLEAVARSVRRLTMPLAASTITTILSFLPLLLLPGPAGDFVGSIAISVIVMLAWSFVVAVTITPAIAGRWLRMGDGLPAREGPLMRGFRALMALSMANPLRTVALSLVLPVIGFLSLPTLTPQFFPGVDRDQFHIEVDLPPGTGISETMRLVREVDARLTADEDILDVAWVVGRSAPAFYYNMVGDRDQAPAFAQALIRTASPAATERMLNDLQADLPPAFLQARFVIRSLTQGPPVNAPVELRLVGQDIDALRLAGDELRARLADVSTVAMVRTGIAGGSPKLTLDIDEARARLLGLDLGQVARQMEAGLEGVTGGSLLEGTEELPVRVRLGAGLRGDPVAIGDMPILPPGAAAVAGSGQFPAVPLSTLGTLRLEPSESTITRRNGERVNTVQAFLMPGILPAVALAEAMAVLEAGGYAPPQGTRLETGGDSDARNSTVQALIAPLGLIITLSIAVVVMTFNSFRLTLIAFTVAGLSAGLSMLALAIFDYPFGINAIIGVIGSIGVSINAALIMLSGLQEDPRAASGDRAAMVDVVAGSARHITSTTITTFGGFLPLILGGGGFWPPFAMSVAGGVALSVTLAFAFTPQMFALTALKAETGRRPTCRFSTQNYAAPPRGRMTSTPQERATEMTDKPTKDSTLKRRFGSTALVTGASDGIGRAFAVQLAEHGFDLILVARRGDALQEIALDLGARFGVEVRVMAMDLSDPSAVPDLMSHTESTPVGLVVAAAGFGSIGSFLDQDMASEINMVDLNCRSVVELSYGFGQRMAAERRGGLVLFGSLVGFNGAPLSATYAATKGFVQSFAEGIAAEMRPHGVSVLSVAPGPVGTGFAARAGMQMGQSATPEVVARSALAALGRRTTVRPGFLAKFLGWSLAMLPRWGRVRVMGVIMKGMIGKETSRSAPQGANAPAARG